ncbi:7TM diverse intracellular signaling domain-containing protein [Paenibacillus contaminans]|uniref:sensor histidine kinase n=1 Tax=Paenibacillus contaminans TaxID=450362 RepID=UPI0013146600|nr:7TM diverse intracellular signaling domain-containing protein [Paenibacillus contaminans]
MKKIFIRGGVGLETLVIGCMLVIGVSHLGYSFIRRSVEPSAIYFVLFGIAMTAHTPTTGLGFQWPLGGISGKGEYLSFSLGLPLLSMYVHSLFPNERWRPAIWFIQLYGAVLSLLTLLAPERIFADPVPMILGLAICFGGYTLAMLAAAIRRRRKGASLLLCGWGVFVGGSIHDIALLGEKADHGVWFTAGLIALIITQTYMLGAGAAKVMASAEKQTRDLKARNSMLEAKMTERTTGLVVANLELEKANAELERSERSRRSMLAKVSNDFGTPLKLIKGYLEAIMDDEAVSPAQRQKYLRLIHSRMAGMQHHMEDLFEVSRLEASNTRFQYRKMSVGQLIAHVDSRYEMEVAATKRRYELIVPLAGSDSCEIEVDVNRIDQLFTHIVYKAVSLTPEGGAVRIGFMLEERELAVRIAGSGEGLEPDDLTQLFDSSSSWNGDNRLAIGKEIVELHGGRIWAESRIQEGTAITFTIPLMRAARMAAGGE